MQFRSRLIMAMLFALAGAAPCLGQVSTSTITIMDDSAGSVEFYIGDTTTNVDYDTSIVYNAAYWEEMTLQAKFASIADPDSGGADSGAVTVILQMSNDGQYWFNIDTLLAVDSLPAFAEFTLKPFGLARFIVQYATKSDSAGVTGRTAVFVRGRY